MAKHDKPARYDHFRELVLLKIKDPLTFQVTREMFVEWTKIVAKTIRNHQVSIYKDIRERDRQMTTLHQVMMDLEKEKILSRVRRHGKKCCTKYIVWSVRRPKLVIVGESNAED